MQASLRRLNELLDDDRIPPEIAERLRRSYEERRSRAAERVRTLGDDEAIDKLTAGAEAVGRVRRVMIDAQRDELIRWRDAGRLPDSSLRILLRELDLQEGSLPA